MKVITKGKSSNYQRFQVLEGNREFSKPRADALALAMNEKNLLPLFPLVCVKNGADHLKVLDGQHRLAAAAQLNIPVDYVLVDDLSLDDMRRINGNQTPWATKDYLHHFVQLGYSDYIKLERFCRDNKIGVMVAAAMLHGENTTSGALTKHFRSGKFKFRNESTAYIVAKVVKSLRFHGYQHAAGRIAVLGLCRIVKTGRFHIDVFESKAAAIAATLEPCANWEQFVRMFSDAYDYRRRVADRSDLHHSVMVNEREEESRKRKEKKGC